MKKVMFVGAAIAALMLANAAHAEGNGFAGVIYNDTSADAVGDSSGFAVEGAAAFGEAVTFEADVMASNTDDGSAFSATGHLYKRTEHFLAGAYVSYTDDEASTTEYGVEGNIFANRVTLAGAYGVAETEVGPIDVEARGFSVEARVFPNDHLRLQAGIGRATADVIYIGDVDFSTWGGGMEFQFGDGPLSASLAYANASVDDLDISVDTITIGLRYNWGGSLFERDRHGASQGHSSAGASFIF